MTHHEGDIFICQIKENIEAVPAMTLAIEKSASLSSPWEKIPIAFLSFSISPQSATAPVLPVGVLQYPSVPCVQVGSFSTKVSVWRPVGKDSTPRTTPATVRAYISCEKFFIIFHHCQSAFFDLSPPLLFRLSSLLPFLCGTPGLRLPPLSQTGGSPPSTVQSHTARHLHSWMSCTQLPGFRPDMQRCVCMEGSVSVRWCVSAPPGNGC